MPEQPKKDAQSEAERLKRFECFLKPFPKFTDEEFDAMCKRVNEALEYSRKMAPPRSEPTEDDR